MKTQNLRIGVRIPKQLRERIENIVSSGRYDNISELIREAVEIFLKERTSI